MPDPLTIGLTAVSIADAIFSGDSPQEQALKELAGELDKSWVAQGLSQAERINLLQNFKSMILKQGQTARARTRGSLARRDADPSTINKAMLGIGLKEAEAVNKLPGDILSQHLGIARKRYDALLNRYTSLAGSTRPAPGLGGALGEFSKQYSYYNWNKQNRPFNPLDEQPRNRLPASPLPAFDASQWRF